MEYKFEHSKIFWSFFKGIAIWVILFVLFSIFLNNAVFIFSKIGLILFAIILLPNTILFIQYFTNDRNSVLIFKRRYGHIEYLKSEVNKIYKIEEITRVKLIVPPGQSNKSSIQLYPQDSYFYYIFYFSSNEKIVITSLLLGGEKINPINLKGIAIEEKIVFFPFLK